MITCAVEVWLQGRRVKSTTQETGVRILPTGIQVVGAMGNQILRPASILNVAAPLAHEGKLTCTMKSSGTLLVLSQLDHSQTTRLLHEFTKYKTQIVGLKMTKRPLQNPPEPPPKKMVVPGAACSNGRVQKMQAVPLVGSGAASTNGRVPKMQAGPLVGSGAASSSNRQPHAENETPQKTHHERLQKLAAQREEVARRLSRVEKAAVRSLALLELPFDIVNFIHILSPIPTVNRMWTRYRQRETVRMRVNGQSATGLPVQSVIKFLQKRPRLQDVEILGVPLLSAQLKTIPKDVPHFASLQRLILRKCTNITDAGMAQILRISRKLVVLDIVECPKVSAQSFAHSVAPLQRLACGNPKTSTSRLNDTMFNKSMQLSHLVVYNATALTGLALNWFLLTYLDIRACNVNDDSAPIIAQVASLHHLNIAGNSNLTDAGVADILWGCNQLESLDLSFLPVDFLDLEACKRLKRLKISHCQEMRAGEEVAKGEMRAFRALEILPELTQIDVSYIDLGAFPEQILSKNFGLISGLQERNNVDFVGNEFLKAMQDKGIDNISVCPGMRHVFEPDMQPFSLR